jgi:hypothetical protein
MKDLETKFSPQESPISEALFERKQITNEINLLIDLEKINDYTKLLTQTKSLNIQKLKFIFFFITLVNILCLFLYGSSYFKLLVNLPNSN